MRRYHRRYCRENFVSQQLDNRWLVKKSCPPKNCYNVYMNMKRRKDDSCTYFLDELREKLNKRMVESDLKGGRFKKR
uniref:RteC domain-containing protein n=1 Tax=Parasutterella excrementihominis TaxID=487175 RepID=UPI003FEF51A2